MGRRITLSRYATQITRPKGDSADGDLGYSPKSHRRVAALFANGGFLPFLRATRAVSAAALELTALIPGAEVQQRVQGERFMPLNSFWDRVEIHWGHFPPRVASRGELEGMSEGQEGGV